jgi:DNA excision repair protein ERCC-4
MRTDASICACIGIGSGFVKAFTDDPMSLALGFGKTEKILRSLYLRKLFLWPRFHDSVHRQLARGKAEVRIISS